ncbi:MAG: flagellin lysine-N-methylase [Lachnospiraceae bacterium]
MGYIRRPSYYKNFQCISSRCTDSCCTEWEIDIDSDTLSFYQQVPGAFGKRLREHIALPSEETDEPAHFIQTADERCPFLNDCNLCDIFIHLGEEHLSQICTHHPRYYDWFLNGEEAGLGLCCEEAARLILLETGFPEFELLEDGLENEISKDEDICFEEKIEQTLFSMRDQLFHQIKSDSSPVKRKSIADFDELMNSLFRTACRMQNTLDTLMFPSGEEEDTDCFELPSDFKDFSVRFWNETPLDSLLDFFLSLEINDPNWWNQLKSLKKNSSRILSARKEFADFYQEKFYEYEQLLIYFLYRHFMKARIDGALLDAVRFALISSCMIQILDIDIWLKTGTLDPVQQINICKLYSKEIEYDEDNTLRLSMYEL